MTNPARRPGTLVMDDATTVTRTAGAVVLVGGVACLLLARFSSGGSSFLASRGLWLAGTLGALLCLAAWLVPWSSLPRGSSLAVPVAALALLVLVDDHGFAASAASAAAYPVYLLLVLTWVGLHQPRHTALAFSLCAGSAAAFVLTRHADAALELWSLAVVLPVGVALGETSAWLAARGRAFDRREERWAGDLARLTTLLADLAAAQDLDRAATLVARGATELFASPGARVELQSDDGTRARAQHGQLSEVTTSIPLVGAQREVGLVELQRPRPADGAYHDSLAQLFAIQVGTTVAQLHTISELGRAARRDALTGTGNRRHATELLGTLRTGDALLVVDLDRFKSVNDTWGHRAGDEVLHNLGTYLQACVRSSDDVARLGGDEFVVVARAAGRDVMATANRLLRGWREGSHRTTISIGVALHRVDGAAEDTFDRADAALYQAKSEGRDRAVLAEQ